MKVCSFKFTLTTLLGNMIEWYDFALYGYFATVILTMSQNAQRYLPLKSQALFHPIDLF
jgi:hypothetical protein